MDVIDQLVVFTLHEHSYALHLAAVERIVLVVHIDPLPSAPPIVLGIVNVHGRIVPVVDVRKRFGLAEREIALNDHLIIASTSRRPVALLVGAVKGVIEWPHSQMIAGDSILPATQYVEGVVKLDDGLLLIHDLDTFLSPLEETKLEQALAQV